MKKQQKNLDLQNYKEVQLNATLTKNLVFQGLKNEINRIVANAKKQAHINKNDKLEINILIAISYKDLKKYTKNENKRISSKNIK